MFKKYVAHIEAKSPHHRRQHAMQVAGVMTALAFVVWVTTLGMRFGSSSAVAQDGQGDGTQQTQLAGAGAVSDTSQSGLEVVSTSTTSAFSNYDTQDTGYSQ